jgi:hypothetical protein
VEVDYQRDSEDLTPEEQMMLDVHTARQTLLRIEDQVRTIKIVLLWWLWAGVAVGLIWVMLGVYMQV